MASQSLVANAAQASTSTSVQHVSAPDSSAAAAITAETTTSSEDTLESQRQGMIMLVLPRFSTAKQTTTPKSNNSVNPNKYVSKLMLQRVHAAGSFADVRDFTTAIVKLYHGKGMHPLSAIKKLATFPGAFDTAVEQLFEAFAKASSPANYRDHSKYLKSLRKTLGALGRYIKNFDQALSWIISKNWLHLVKEGKDLSWLPMYVEDRISGIWSNLLDTVLPAFCPQQAFSKKVPKIFVNSLGLLRFCQTRCTAGIKVMRVAGHRLPPELVNLIKEMAIGRGEFLRVVENMLSGKFGNNLRMLVISAALTPAWYENMRRVIGYPDLQMVQTLVDRYPRIFG